MAEAGGLRKEEGVDCAHNSLPAGQEFMGRRMEDGKIMSTERQSSLPCGLTSLTLPCPGPREHHTSCGQYKELEELRPAPPTTLSPPPIPALHTWPFQGRAKSYNCSLSSIITPCLVPSSILKGRGVGRLWECVGAGGGDGN